MFDSIRDKLHSFQENLTTTLKGLSVNDPLNRRQIINETVPVNLNAGADVISRFQSSWAELHEASQENAAKAEEIDALICKFHRNVEKQWRDVGQLAGFLTSLPEVVHNLNELSEKILVLEGLFEAVYEGLIQLEDVLDTKEFQNKQLEQRFQLVLYEKKKLAGLENTRMKLAEELAEKVRRHEVRQQRLLRECQLASEENFKQDLKVYKETNVVPKIEFAKSKNASNESENDLKDIVLDNEDTSALDEFLNESKDTDTDKGDGKEWQHWFQRKTEQCGLKTWLKLRDLKSFPTTPPVEIHEKINLIT